MDKRKYEGYTVLVPASGSLLMYVTHENKDEVFMTNIHSTGGPDVKVPMTALEEATTEDVQNYNLGQQYGGIRRTFKYKVNWDKVPEEKGYGFYTER